MGTLLHAGEAVCFVRSFWLLVTETHLENQPCVGGTDILLYRHGAEQVQQPGRAGTRVEREQALAISLLFPSACQLHRAG